MNTINITLQQIKDCKPCAEGWKKLLSSKNKTKADDEPFPLSDVLDSNGLHDAIWCFRALPERINLWRKFSCWSARQAKPSMQDQRSINCLKVVQKYLEGNASNEELYAAYCAAEDAADAAASVSYAAAASVSYAADAVSAEVYAAAASAAYAAVYVARAAYNADYHTDAVYAARAAARAVSDAVSASVYDADTDAVYADADAVYADADAVYADAIAAQEAKLKQILNTAEWVD